jgi:hypothetical protein
MDAHDVGVIQRRQCMCLLSKPLRELRIIHTLWREQFQSDEPVE